MQERRWRDRGLLEIASVHVGGGCLRLAARLEKFIFRGEIGVVYVHSYYCVVKFIDCYFVIVSVTTLVNAIILCLIDALCYALEHILWFMIRWFHCNNKLHHMT